MLDKMTPIPPPTIPHEVRDLLTRLRTKIRLYVGIEGLAVVVATLGLLFWGGLLFDWLLEPSVGWRVAIWSVAAIGLVVIAQRWLWQRLTVPLSDQSLALLLERHDPGVADHLATAVTLAETPIPVGASEHNSAADELASRTNAAAIDATRNLDIRSLLDPTSCLRAVTVAALLASSIALFSYQANETFGFWLRRVALAEEAWPRQVRLEVVGFPTGDDGQRVATMARHDDFELAVHADLTDGFIAPDRVQIRFELPDGRWGRDYLTRVGLTRVDETNASGQEQQVFRYEFKNVRENITFDIVGGDARVRGLQLRVVSRPEIVQINLECEYPEYLNQSPQSLPYTRGMRIPLGTRLQIKAQTNKPIATLDVQGETSGLSIEESFGPESYSPKVTNDVRFRYGELLADESLSIQFTDQHGIAGLEPYRMPLSVIPDELPQLAVKLRGIGAAVTPDATIPFQGEITDDYGLAEAWFEVSIDTVLIDTTSIDTAEPHRHEFQDSPAGRTELTMAESLDLRQPFSSEEGQPITLKPGHRLAILVAASDECTLGDGSREGRSQQFLLDVVTPTELLVEIERRELAFRQHFEAIVNKVTDTRNLLARIEFPQKRPPGETDDVPKDDMPKNDDTRAAALRRLRVAGARQNMLQAADEVLGIAEGFENLHDQLVNNRIDDNELMSRLQERIARPLLAISQSQMPPLISQLKLTQLKLTQQQLFEPVEAAKSLKTAMIQTDAIIVDMQEVLERMLELETYNEVVALLRGIISDQKGLSDRTKQRRKQSVQSLFED